MYQIHQAFCCINLPKGHGERRQGLGNLMVIENPSFVDPFLEVQIICCSDRCTLSRRDPLDFHTYL